jgi:hypothetical protein
MNKLSALWKLGWPGGLFMFGMFELIPLVKTREFIPSNILIGLLIWSAGALWIGYVIQRVKNAKK